MLRVAGLTATILALLAAPAGAATVVADHLARPRGLALAPDGTLYATLVGRGGRKCNFEGCFGATGSIVRVGSDGAVMTVTGGLLSMRGQSGRLVFVTPGGKRAIGPNISAVEYRDDPDAQSVPAALIAGTDGALYVGEYTGNLSAGHDARIWRVVPGAAPTLFASGLTTISALATGPDGALYATEFRPGRVIRIAPDGTRTTVATGLHHPGGIAVGKDGAVYVSDWSVAGATRKDAYRRHTGRILRVQ